MRADWPRFSSDRHVDIHQRRDRNFCRVVFFVFLSISLILFAASVVRAQTVPAIANPTTSPSPIDVKGEIPPAELLGIDRAALGTAAIHLEDATILEVHKLLESYFAATSAGEKSLIVRQLYATGIDPNALGQLCHVRTHWPALSPGVYYINDMFGPQPVHYFLGIPPNYTRDTPWPLVITLPGPNAFLTDPPPDGNQVAAIYSGWMNEALSRHPDAVVLMPLLNLDTLYGPGYPGMYCVIDAMLHTADRVNIDPARVYLVGHSMAANAVWNLALHFPTYFAAINPMAGGASADWQRLRMMNLLNVYPVVWADTDDQVTPSSQSGELVSILHRFKIDVSFTQTQGIGHAPSPDLVDKLYGLMRGRVRDLYPRRVMLQSNRPDTIFNRVDWLQLFQETDLGQIQRVYFARAMGYMMVYQNTFKADAALTHPNEFDVSTDNVESMRILLNSQMVDFAKPVIVRVNGKVRFNAMVNPDIEETLKDQIFLGRGWRTFVAHADVDFAALDQEPMGKSTTAPASQPTAGSIQIVMPDGSVKTITPHKDEPSQ